MKSRFYATLTGTFLVLISNNLLAATVTQKSEKHSAVVINEGSNSNFAKGDVVCFYNSSKKRVACGKISVVKENSSIIRVSRARFPSIQKGFEARLNTQSSSSNVVSGGTSSGASSTNTSTSSSELTSKWGLGVHHIVSLMPQTKITPPIRVFGQTKNWDEPSLGMSDTLNYMGFGFSLQYSLSPSMYLDIGGRYRALNKLSAQSNSASGTPDPYILSEVIGTQMGFWTDFYFYRLSIGSSSGVDLGGGVDIESSSVDFRSSYQGTGTINNALRAEGSGSKMVASIRLPIAFTMSFGSFNIGTKVIPMFAVASFGDGAKVDNGADKPTAATDTDYVDALVLDKSGLAVEIIPIGITYRF